MKLEPTEKQYNFIVNHYMKKLTLNGEEPNEDRAKYLANFMSWNPKPPFMYLGKYSHETLKNDYGYDIDELKKDGYL